MRRVGQGWTVKAAATVAGISERRAYHRLKRYREEGVAGLVDRSCRPRRAPNKTPKRVRERIIALRHRRQTCHEMAQRVGVSASTVARILGQVGLQRLKALDPKPPVHR